MGEMYCFPHSLTGCHSFHFKESFKKSSQIALFRDRQQGGQREQVTDDWNLGMCHSFSFLTAKDWLRWHYMGKKQTAVRLLHLQIDTAFREHSFWFCFFFPFSL